MADSKSVIEHLEDIEEQLKSKESEQVTISSLIGEPFDPYFDSSTIYYYESDERRFDKHKQRQITKHHKPYRIVGSFRIGYCAVSNHRRISGFQSDSGPNLRLSCCRLFGICLKAKEEEACELQMEYQEPCVLQIREQAGRRQRKRNVRQDHDCMESHRRRICVGGCRTVVLNFDRRGLVRRCLALFH